MPTSELKVIQSTTARILSHPTWDLMLLFVLIAIGFFYGISRGRHKMVSTVLNTYVALAVFNAIPLDPISQLTGIKDLFLIKTGVFLIIFVALTFLLNRGRPRIFSRTISWWQVFLLSFVQTGLLMHIIFSFLPQERINSLAPLTRSFFANPHLTIWWLILPLFLLILFRRMGRDD